MEVIKPQVFINEEEITNNVLALTPKEARKIRISKNGPSYLRKNVRKGKLNFNAPNPRKIIKYYLVHK